MIKVIERREQEFIPNIILLKLEIPLVKHNSWMLPEVKDYGKGEGGGGEFKQFVFHPQLFRYLLYVSGHYLCLAALSVYWIPIYNYKNGCTHVLFISIISVSPYSTERRDTHF